MCDIRECKKIQKDISEAVELNEKKNIPSTMYTTFNHRVHLSYFNFDTSFE